MKYSLFLISLIFQFTVISSHSETKAPNVLFISVDDLNDWAGYRGHEQVISPNMDKLAGESTWFSQAYCQYPVCGPSRASIMSGLYFHQLDSKRLQIKDDVLEEKVESMGSQLLHAYFKDNGYKTMAVGKILHKHLPKKNLDLSGGRGGWGRYTDENGKKAKANWQSDKTLTDWAYSQTPEPKMTDSKAAKWAVERLGEKHDKPFMLMVGFLRPHVPWYVPKKYFDMYDREKITLPPYKADDLNDVPKAGRGTLNDGYPRTEWAIENNQWKHIVQSYLASITFVDSKVGEVLDALEDSPYKDNTIVVLWSDHGYHMGEKNTFQKHTLWERSAVTPLLIKLPPHLQSKQSVGKCERNVGLIDIYPTLLDLCNLPPNEKVVGRSLKPLLENPTQKWNFPALTYRKNNGKSIRFGHYRYIEYGDGSSELYDHSKDPNEWENVVEKTDYANALKGMKAKLAESHIE